MHPLLQKEDLEWKDFAQCKDAPSDLFVFANPICLKADIKGFEYCHKCLVTTQCLADIIDLPLKSRANQVRGGTYINRFGYIARRKGDLGAKQKVAMGAYWNKLFPPPRQRRRSARTN